MKFVLTYAGRLPSNGDAKKKHKIRQELHPQLKELWRTHPALSDNKAYISHTDGEPDQRAALLSKVGDYEFAALVHPYLRLYVELDVLMLRPEAPGAVISHSGDIDNQVKTLFDALRRPSMSSEIPSSWTPNADETPLHTLVDDDKLITRVTVDTDRLLIPGGDPKDVQLIISVTVKGFTATWGNLGIIA